MLLVRQSGIAIELAKSLRFPDQLRPHRWSIGPNQKTLNALNVVRERFM